ncbi:MAG TPA: hypothetical protein DCP75_06215 [Haliea salexigens]|uniref:Uncharacterized protein n=1 Tax=Haliea salexigens TaxID=287487 RepID=A0A3C1KLH6_9GAMM|nr:hypothetical protein [Haliea sp.]HAN27303.1 hypothetical protein [Haliea salexigens]
MAQESHVRPSQSDWPLVLSQVSVSAMIREGFEEYEDSGENERELQPVSWHLKSLATEIDAVVPTLPQPKEDTGRNMVWH